MYIYICTHVHVHVHMHMSITRWSGGLKHLSCKNIKHAKNAAPPSAPPWPRRWSRPSCRCPFVCQCILSMFACFHVRLGFFCAHGFAPPICTVPRCPPLVWGTVFFSGPVGWRSGRAQVREFGLRPGFRFCVCPVVSPTPRQSPIRIWHRRTVAS